MKKINKGFKFLLVLSIFLSTGSTVFATTVTDPTGVGGQTATIDVNSLIGDFDNTDPNSPDPGGDADHPTWLNVTVPTAVLFQSSAADVNILESANFDIINHSGRGVDVSLVDFDLTSAPATMAAIDFLDIIAAGGVTNHAIELIHPTGITANPGLLMTVARNNDATFNFDGIATATTGAVYSPTFDLVLGFAVNGNY